VLWKLRPPFCSLAFPFLHAVFCEVPCCRDCVRFSLFFFVKAPPLVFLRPRLCSYQHYFGAIFDPGAGMALSTPVFSLSGSPFFTVSLFPTTIMRVALVDSLFFSVACNLSLEFVFLLPNSFSSHSSLSFFHTLLVLAPPPLSDSEVEFPLGKYPYLLFIFFFFFSLSRRF